MKLPCLLLVLLISSKLFSQFAPVVGAAGSSAMDKDSSAFIGWATQCQVLRGYQDVSTPTLGLVTVGTTTDATGKAGVNGVLSLGDGGYAILQFASPIKDSTGNDFAVFENSFNSTFLELAFVEVSSDGINYFRFDATSNTDTITQTWSAGSTDATLINNLAGKYQSGYGTPFNISEIADNALLNKKSITHVKIIDVVGSIQNQYCTRDVNYHKINDPWPTPYPSSGFDLDAIGVIYNQTQVGINEYEMPAASIYPNPVVNELHLMTQTTTTYNVNIINVVGDIIKKETNLNGNASITLSDLTAGVYFLTITSGNKTQRLKFVKG